VLGKPADLDRVPRHQAPYRLADQGIGIAGVLDDPQKLTLNKA
jgi:hypothetical protein